MVRTAALVLCLALAQGCEPGAADQLMVRVIDGTGGHLLVPEDLDAFEIRVSSLSGPLDGGTSLVRYRRSFPLRGARSGRGTVALPQTLAIVPEATGGGTVSVDVYGLKNGRVLQRIHRIAAFGVGLVELPPFALTPLCFGVECSAGQTCESDGTCRDVDDPCLGGRCDAGTGPCGALAVACGDECIPYDDANCGGCGVACPSGQRCVSNVCTCPAGTVRCGSACVDLSTDPMNCGACGTVCDSTHGTSECRLGACDVASCDSGFADCDGSEATGCESPACTAGGACTTACGSTGTATCGAGACPTACTVPAETCNGVDDDCDGTVDECPHPEDVCYLGECDYPPPDCTAEVYGGHLYAICDIPVDWFYAWDVCDRWGGYLVTVDDAAEAAFLATAAPGWRWTGLADIDSEGTFQWDVGSSAYTEWCAGEPSATCCYGEYPGCAPAGEDQDCVAMGFDCTGGGVGWDDQHCCWENAFVCEYQ